MVEYQVQLRRRCCSNWFHCIFLLQLVVVQCCLDGVFSQHYNTINTCLLFVPNSYESLVQLKCSTGSKGITRGPKWVTSMYTARDLSMIQKMECPPTWQSQLSGYSTRVTVCSTMLLRRVGFLLDICLDFSARPKLDASLLAIYLHCTAQLMP